MIEVEGLSKRYRLGNWGSGTLSQDLQEWWRSGLRGGSNEAEEDDGARQRQDYVWSLKNLNFTVHRGDVFGVVGKNGAGKSTLLKLLSKITKPTSGVIRLEGRVASLLEVGTGFHPDLSGRENIFLNGAILGMSRTEIKRKFDEIVAFSEIGKYIDTPVKRYSSGMYVRLGFAVAAHLDPEILIVDEVLAVGDQAFQQKCLGKMQDVSSHGRTVLFVSHHIPSVKQLCNRGILIENGRQVVVGDVEQVLARYQHAAADSAAGVRGEKPGRQAGFFTDWRLEGEDLPGTHSCFSRDYCCFTFGFSAEEDFLNCEVRLMIHYESLLIAHVSSKNNSPLFSLRKGVYRFNLGFELPIRDSKLDVEFVFISGGNTIDSWRSTTKLTILDTFNSHVYNGMLNPEVRFSMHQELELSC